LIIEKKRIVYVSDASISALKNKTTYPQNFCRLVYHWNANSIEYVECHSRMFLMLSRQVHFGQLADVKRFETIILE
jgi:hypothetical protein